jgi:hypothetical protein
MTANKSTRNAHDEIIKRLLGGLPSGYTYEQVKLPNMRFTTPSNDRWLRLSIITLDTENTQAGSNPWERTEALAVVDIFYPTGSFLNPDYPWSADAKPNMTDAEVIKSLFSNQRFNGVNCEEATIDELGDFEGRVTESGTWFQTQVSINFYYEGC